MIIEMAIPKSRIIFGFLQDFFYGVNATINSKYSSVFSID